MNLEEKIRAARVHLILTHPFIAVPLLRLRLQADPKTPTASTDGRSLRYNPEFMSSLTLEQSAFVLAHEAFHVILAHHLRRSHRSVKIWNAAGDFIVNDLLHRAGLPLLPGVLHDSRYSGWSTERVYEDLLSEGDRQARASGDSLPADFVPEGFGGSVEDLRSEDGSPLLSSDRAREQAELATALNQALHALQLSRGDQTLREALTRAVAALSPAFDARAALLQYADRHFGGDDYSWARPNRRYLSSGVYLPSLSIAPGFDELILAVDTSGSIGQRHLRFMAGVCEDVLTAFPKTLLQVLYCDTAVRGDQEFTVDDLPLSFGQARGGGGTRFEPVFEWVETSRKTPRLLIFLSDLECTDHPQEPSYPVLWLSVSKSAPSLPFGDRIDLNL